MFSENDPFIGTKHAIECPPAEVNECAQHMWDCMVGIYENRSDREKIGAFFGSPFSVFIRSHNLNSTHSSTRAHTQIL